MRSDRRAGVWDPSMKIWSRTLVPTLVLAAAVAANEPPPQAEPQATGATNERAAVNELRPTQDLRPQEKRPAVRVILPSPYATSR
jgi:hypothetical protein